MRFLRAVLLIGSVIGFLFALLNGLDVRNTDIEAKIAEVVVAALFGLNFFYVRHFPLQPGQGRPRLLTLISLWFDAKESELKRRAGSKISN